MDGSLGLMAVTLPCASSEGELLLFLEAPGTHGLLYCSIFPSALMEPTTNADDQAQAQHSDVYERLYDVRSYTGVYRKRFELDIHDLTDTVVHELSGTIRTNLNRDVEGRPRRPTLSPRLSSGNLNAAAAAATATLAIDPTAPRQSPEHPPCPSPIRLEGDPNDPHTLLRAVFHYYCRFGRTGAKGANETTMDNSNFSKLCRECPGLLGAGFTRTDVDLIFVKAKKKGERRVNYTRFLDALGMIAIQKFPEMSLELSVPTLLQAHISKLPCIVEFTDGKQVQAVWSRRLEREDSQSSSSSAPPSPLSRRSSTPHASPPKSSSKPAASPPPAPSSSPRLHRRLSSPITPPTSSAGEVRGRRPSKNDDTKAASPSKVPPAPHGSFRRTPQSSSVAVHGQEEEDDEEDDDECVPFYAS